MVNWLPRNSGVKVSNAGFDIGGEICKFVLHTNTRAYLCLNEKINQIHGNRVIPSFNGKSKIMLISNITIQIYQH
jgi:hypothetical protein